MKLKKLKEHIIKAAVWSIVVMTCFMTIQMFVVLKLTGTVDWSWWWIASPLWIPCLAFMAVLLLLLLGALVVYIVVGHKQKALHTEMFPGLEDGESNADDPPSNGGLVH